MDSCRQIEEGAETITVKSPIMAMWEAVYEKFLFSSSCSKSSLSSLSRFLVLLERNQDLIFKILYKQIQLFYEKLGLDSLCLVMGFVDNSDVRYHYILDGVYGIPLALNAESQLDDLFAGAYFLLGKLQHIFTRSDEVILIAHESYDNASFITRLWDQYRIKPVISLKNHSEITYVSPFPWKNVSLSSMGEVFCISPVTKKKKRWFIADLKRSVKL